MVGNVKRSTVAKKPSKTPGNRATKQGGKQVAKIYADSAEMGTRGGISIRAYFYPKECYIVLEMTDGYETRVQGIGCAGPRSYNDCFKAIISRDFDYIFCREDVFGNDIGWDNACTIAYGD